MSVPGSSVTSNKCGKTESTQRMLLYIYLSANQRPVLWVLTNQRTLQPQLLRSPRLTKSSVGVSCYYYWEQILKNAGCCMSKYVDSLFWLQSEALCKVPAWDSWINGPVSPGDIFLCLSAFKVADNKAAPSIFSDQFWNISFYVDIYFSHLIQSSEIFVARVWEIYLDV